jgi:hypothetical protein
MTYHTPPWRGPDENARRVPFHQDGQASLPCSQKENFFQPSFLVLHERDYQRPNHEPVVDFPCPISYYCELRGPNFPIDSITCYASLLLSVEMKANQLAPY